MNFKPAENLLVNKFLVRRLPMVKMKNFFVSILTVFYLAGSAAPTFHFHYCMGKLVEWGLGHRKSETCSKCGMDKSEESSNDCCKDKLKQIRIEQEQKKTETIDATRWITTINAIPVTIFDSIFCSAFLIAREHNFLHGPPGIGTNIYIFNCVFRI